MIHVKGSFTHEGEVGKTFFSKRHSVLISNGEDEKLRIWSFPEGKQVACIESLCLDHVVVFNDGDSLAWSCLEGIYLSKISNLKEKVLLTPKRSPPKDVVEIKPIITGMSVSPRGDFIAYVDAYSGLHMISLASRTIVTVDSGKKNGVFGEIKVVRFSSNGPLLAYSNAINEVELRTGTELKRVRTIGNLSDRIRHLSFSHDDKYISVSLDSKATKVYDVLSGKEVCSFQDFVIGEFSPVAHVLAIANNKGRLRIIDMTKVRVQEQEFSLSWKSVNSISWQPDGRVIQIGSNSRRIRFFDSVSRKEILKHSVGGDEQ